MAGDVQGSRQAAGSDQAQDSKDPVRPGSGDAPLALYRRYRPASFAEVKGQDHVTGPLRQALRSGRVHHAYLFSGPRGCGKTSSARILARSLNCEAGPTPDPCGVCASCVALSPAGAGSIDVIEIDAASHGGIDDARDLRERAFYSPVAARYKIYIIDEAHMVTGAGFNALLKLVEEPPPHLKFVFATTEPEKVIATIRSRTHHYPFRLVPPAVLRELLEEILGSEKIAYEPSVLPVVIRAGAGSVRDTLSVVDQLIAGSDESGLRYDRAIALLGYTDDALLDEMADAFATSDGAAVFVAIDRVVEAGHDPRRFAMDLLDRLRDLIVLAAVPGAVASGLLSVPEDRLDRMRGQVARFGQERLVRAAETISNGLVEMRGATSPRLLLELMCAQVLLPAGAPASGAAPAPDGGPDVLARVERLERELLERPLAAQRTAGPDGGRTGQRDAEARPAGTARSAGTAQQAGVTRPDVPEAMSAQASTAQASTAQASAPQASAPQANAPQASAPQASAMRAGTPQPQGGRDATAGQDRAQAGIDEATLRDQWHEVLGAVREVRKTAWILLSNHATIDTLEGNVLTLAFDAEGNAKGFASSGSDGHLAEVLGARFGARLVIRTIVRPGAGRERVGSSATGTEARARGHHEPDGYGEPGSLGQPGGYGQPRGHHEPGDHGETTDRREPGAMSAANGATSMANGADSAASPRAAASRRDTMSPRDTTPTRTAAMAARGVDKASSVASAAPGRSAVSTAEDDPRLDTDSDEADMAELTGTELIVRELGGQVIEELGGN